jgi:hypothetical protein
VFKRWDEAVGDAIGILFAGEYDLLLGRRTYVLLTACCRICLHRKKINVSIVLAGQRLGIKEVDEGIWIVSFMSYDLGLIDLDQRTLQPLDNPFGPRLLPMSPVRTCLIW